MYFYCPYFFSKIAREKNLDKRLTLTVFFRGQKRDLKFPISRHHWYGKRRHNINRICFFPTKTVYHKNTEGTRGGGGRNRSFGIQFRCHWYALRDSGQLGHNLFSHACLNLNLAWVRLNYYYTYCKEYKNSSLCIAIDFWPCFPFQSRKSEINSRKCKHKS